MVRWYRRMVRYIGIFLVVLGAYTAIYHAGMVYLEGRSPSVFHSLQVVVETFTTVGYGSDAPYTTPAMNLIVTGMMLSGVILVFMALPLVVVPLFEDALSTTPPKSVSDLDDHVVLCGFSSRGETLIDELVAWETDHVIVVDDRDTAIELYEEGWTVIHGDPESAKDLQRAGIQTARAVVADSDDETNASVVLAAREVAPDARVVTVAEDPDNGQYLAYAGADRVLTPRHLLGQSLAEKVTASVSTELGDGVELGEDLEITEVAVDEGCEIAGERLADSGIRERTGANVIGAWTRGSFDGNLDADTVLEPGIILLVSGTERQVEELRELANAETDRPHGQVVIVGYGEVGSTVAGELAAANVPYTIVDHNEHSGVDVLGEATDEETLIEADIESARAVILALPDDTTTAFVTLVIRELAPEVEVVARADEADASQKLYLAGADYVLALGTVSGRMLASEVLEEDVLSPEKQVEIIRVRAPALSGKTIADADIRARTGCTVIAIQRNGHSSRTSDRTFVWTEATNWSSPAATRASTSSGRSRGNRGLRFISGLRRRALFRTTPAVRWWSTRRSRTSRRCRTRPFSRAFPRWNALPRGGRPRSRRPGGRQWSRRRRSRFRRRRNREGRRRWRRTGGVLCRFGRRGRRTSSSPRRSRP